MKEPLKTCPYCMGENIEFDANEQRWHCKDCDYLFDEDDCERENIRHQISAILSAGFHDDSNPLECDIVLESNPENVGLSTLEMPHVVKAFQFQDGTIWFYVYGYEDYTNFDDFETVDLRDILTGLTEF